MIANKKILAVIPARGNSKGLPGKNLKVLVGETLLARTIRIAQQSCYIDRLILSSENDSIIAEALRCGCEVPFKRPLALASDAAAGCDVICHAIKQVSGYDYVVVLQVTSPLRTRDDIDQCIRHCIYNDAPACEAVTKSEKCPQWMFNLGPQGRLQIPKTNIPSNRQEVSPYYCLCGAVAIAKCEWLMQHRTFLSNETLAFIMPKERAIDIDDETDLRYAESYLQMTTIAGTDPIEAYND